MTRGVVLALAGAAAAAALPGCGPVETPAHNPTAASGAPAAAPPVARPDDEGNAPHDTRPSFAPSAMPDAKAGAEQVERLEKGGGVEKSNWVPPGRSERYGHAEILVKGTLEVVRAIVTDVAHYKDLAPGRFKTSRVVDKHEGTTDLYIQIPVLHGLLVLWQVVRFDDLRAPTPGLEIVEGRLVKGNVKNMNIVVVARAVDAERTVVTCDLMIEPFFIAPQAAIDEETRDACGDALASVRDRAEHK